jgi:hypothetical protein
MITVNDFMTLPSALAEDRPFAVNLVRMVYSVLAPLGLPAGPWGDGRAATTGSLFATLVAALQEENEALGFELQIPSRVVNASAENLARLMEESGLVTVNSDEWDEPYKGFEEVGITDKGLMFCSWAESLKSPEEVV